MAIARPGRVQQRQITLRERYRRAPAEAWIRDGAQTINGCGGDSFHGAVIADNSGGIPLCFGIHRAVGGDHDHPNPGDLLSAALAACFDSTLRMLADHLGVRLRSLEVEVEAECDVRGCLLVDRSVPVGFQKMRCSARLQPEGEVDAETLQELVGAAETCCVVLQTLRNGVTVSTGIDRAEPEDAGMAPTPT
ncbi:MAG: OsmC family protein [Limnobacter sp.]|nr:OsmC family protein [Limnobacter sp.]